MSLIEALTTSATVGILAKQAQDFLAAATGHKGESIGTMLGDMVHQARQNAERVTGNAYLTLLNIWRITGACWVEDPPARSGGGFLGR
jgi:hypothetical protein